MYKDTVVLSSHLSPLYHVWPFHPKMPETSTALHCNAGKTKGLQKSSWISKITMMFDISGEVKVLLFSSFFKHYLSILLKADIVGCEIVITVHAVQREFRAHTLCKCCFLIKWHVTFKASMRTSWGQRVYDQRMDQSEEFFVILESYCTLKMDILFNVVIKYKIPKDKVWEWGTD